MQASRLYARFYLLERLGQRAQRNISETGEMNSGIYAILNKINKKLYIGSAINLRIRKNDHLKLLRKNKHYNRYLQSTFNKHKEENFSFLILEYINYKFDLIKREQYYIDRYQSFNRNHGYNLSPTAGSSLGVKFSEEIRLKNNITRKGTKLPKEWSDNISKALKGRKLHPDHIKNRSESRKSNSRWPHELGRRCKCKECNAMKAKDKLEWKRKRNHV